MSAVVEKIKNEPVLVTAFVQAALALVVAFGLSLSAEQIGSILAVTAAALAFIARAKVTPTSKTAGTPEPVDLEADGYEDEFEGGMPQDEA